MQEAGNNERCMMCGQQGHVTQLQHKKFEGTQPSVSENQCVSRSLEGTSIIGSNLHPTDNSELLIC